MAERLTGKQVAAAIKEKASALCAELKGKGIVPTLAVIRVGEKPDDIAYENNAEKTCASVGADFKRVTLPADIDSAAFLKAVSDTAADPQVSGIILMRPLPRGLDEKAALDLIPASKDVDGCNTASLAGAYSGNKDTFFPCTAQAVMEIIEYYGVECSGKRAVVLGRSLLAGKPIAMGLMDRNATVTVCHTRTADPASIAREADILVTATNIGRSVGSDYFREGQTVIDVGICFDEETGKMCGNVRKEDAEETVAAYSPVPGGVGTVTSSILALHTVQAAAKAH